MIFLKEHQGHLDEPYCRHIVGPIRELRIDFGKNRHRVLFFVFTGKNIILLNAFFKKTAKTPPSEILKARKYYQDVLINKELYEK